jgi:hypothetical protein
VEGEGMSARTTMKKRAAAAQRTRQNPKFVALARRLTPADVRARFHNGDHGYAIQSGFFAEQEKREIYVPYLRTASDLRLYLHELGHVLDWPRSDSEAEYRAEAYAIRMMRSAGIPLPRGTLRWARAYAGWFIADDALNGYDVSKEACAFVGLRGVHRISIARAHSIAVERIGYVPKREWIGKGKHKTMMAPADTAYWAALLAAVPAATSSTAAEIEEYEAEQQAMCKREWSYVEDEEGNYYG